MKDRTLTVEGGVLTLEAQDIDYEKGKAIWIRLKGFKGNTDDEECICQVMLEFYNGSFQVHVWDGSSPCQIEIAPRPEYEQVMYARKRELPLLMHSIKDPDAHELLSKRLKGENP